MKALPKSVDVLILGDHPCTYFAASYMATKSGLRVLHAAIPTDNSSNCATLINPLVFKLHAILGSLRDAVHMHPVKGVQFLSDDLTTSSRHVADEALAYVARVRDVSEPARLLTESHGVQCVKPSTLVINRPDPTGVAIVIDGRPVHARALIVGGTLTTTDRRTLGIPVSWEAEACKRICYAELPHNRTGGTKNGRTKNSGAHNSAGHHSAAHSSGGSNGTTTASTNGQVHDVIPMSLDLHGRLLTASMLSTPDATHLIVEQPTNATPNDALQSVYHWANVLAKHGFAECHVRPSDVTSSIVPIGGALIQDGVADRTLLIGPAGGFYSATGEDIYPNCWSAIHAVDVLCQALDRPELQDALDDYRSCWRTTLGVYLQGHQQNLRFLLPFVYKNPTMTARLVEAILVGKNVVR